MRHLRKIPVLYHSARKIKAFNKSICLKIKIHYAKRKGSLKIVVGAARVFETGWIPTEITQINLLHLEDWEKYFEENSIDAILAEHVWEHLTVEDGLVAAKNCYKYLKSDTGYLRVAVPDGYHPSSDYIDLVKVNGEGAGASDHKVLYNHESFSQMFQSAGFTVSLLEYYDRQGKFNLTDWNVNDGLINRSGRFDVRNKNGRLVYTSLILDAIKK